jgi:hypothetical protein
MASDVLRALLRWRRDPGPNAKAIEFAGLHMQLETLLLTGRPIPPDLQVRYDELLRWYVQSTGQLPPRS